MEFNYIEVFESHKKEYIDYLLYVYNNPPHLFDIGTNENCVVDILPAFIPFLRKIGPRQWIGLYGLEELGLLRRTQNYDFVFTEKFITEYVDK